MKQDRVSATIADLSRRLGRLALEVQELKVLYADAPRRGELRSRAWREAYERTRREMARRASEEE